MQNNPAEIVRLARQAQVPFGAHAFVVVQVNGGQFAEASYVVNEHMDAARAYADAEAEANRRRTGQPSLSFYVLEVGAPGETVQDILTEMLAYEAPQFDGHPDVDLNVSGADLVDAFTQWRLRLRTAAPAIAPQGRMLIRTMASLLDEALTTHIYDDGDEVDPDCAYTAAVEEAERYLEAFPAPATPDVRAIAILRALTLDLGEGHHDDVDRLSGFGVVEAAALDLLSDMKLSPVHADHVPDPDDESIAGVYEAALAVAMAEAEVPSAFTAAPIGLLEIAEDLSDAVGTLQHQLDQVCQLHNRYTDDAIVAAHEDGDEAVKRLEMYRKGAPATVLYVNRSENNVDLWSPVPMPGLQVTVLTWDIDDLANYETDDVTMVRFPGAGYEPCLVSTGPVTVCDRTPIMRAATDKDMDS